MKNTLIYFTLLFGFSFSVQAQSSVPLSGELIISVESNPATSTPDPTATTVPTDSASTVTSISTRLIEKPNTASSVFDGAQTTPQTRQSKATVKNIPSVSGYRKSDRAALPIPNEKYVRDENKPGIPLPRETYHR